MLTEVSSRVPGHRIQRRSGSVLTLLALAVMLSTLSLLLATGCSVGPTQTRENSFNVGETLRLVVKSENGGIEINADSGNQVQVEARLKGSNRIEYSASQDGDTITVDVKINRPWWVFGGVGADIMITAPARADVELRTGNGQIELHGLEGFGSLRTSNGEIILENVRGDFDVETSNGRIEIDTMEGSARLRTSNGKADLRDVEGEIDVETSNGSIWFRGNMTAQGSNRLVTSNGDVHVELLGTPSVSLDAKTSNGQVTSELPIVATVTREDHLVGKIGSGEAELYIRTSNGDVIIR